MKTSSRLSAMMSKKRLPSISFLKDFLRKYRANIEGVKKEATELVLDLIWTKEDPNEIKEDFLKKMT